MSRERRLDLFEWGSCEPCGYVDSLGDVLLPSGKLAGLGDLPDVVFGDVPTRLRLKRGFGSLLVVPLDDGDARTGPARFRITVDEAA